MPIANYRDVRNPMTRGVRATPGARPAIHTAVRSPQGIQARPVPPAQQGQWYGNSVFGGSGRSATAQGVQPLTGSDVPVISSQVLFPAPSTLHLKPSTGRPSYTLPYGSAPTDRHAGTQSGATVLRPYGGPAPSPLMLGSYLQMGQSAIKRPVIAPPQPTLLPTVQSKIYTPQIKRKG